MLTVKFVPRMTKKNVYSWQSGGFYPYHTSNKQRTCQRYQAYNLYARHAFRLKKAHQWSSTDHKSYKAKKNESCRLQITNSPFLMCVGVFVIVAV